uniref:Latent transforming growth factor beta binding protein 2 n=1 Tax=Anabas testudineus TaxID=64144 RepID=A0A7N6AJD7_ANATE
MSRPSENSISICALFSADCQPPCQNRGSCSRPHTCVCRSGFQGPRCEEVAPEQVYIRDRGSLRRIQPVRRGPPDSSSQQTGTSRTVKRYPSSSGPITSNALPSGNSNGNGHRNWHGHRTRANLTSNLDRIKIIFTPTTCRRMCSGGRCYNSCEKGDITTVYSEMSQQQQPKNQGFRLFFCQIPCLNGGRCIGRDQCRCPSNSTGKFCHLPVPPPARPTPHSHKDAGHQGSKSPSHSMYTLPLSNQQVSLHPSLVNVHIQHPPEAEVQIHQVARVQPGQRPATTEGAHSVQQRSQPTNGHELTDEHSTRHPHTNGNGNGHGRLPNHHNGHVGRCFQETVDGQCGKPLPGLTKQDDCCGSVGASWGLNKCQKCPTKPAYAVIANGQVECPKGFKRMNVTHCQDINECLLPGICKNAECLNSKGSYRCTCKQGYMLDPARSHCVSDKAVSDQKALCYRSVSAVSCSLPLPHHITKQICCCSRVGKAWGAGCDRCPLPGSDHFKEICPAGHGYTYLRSDVQISLRQLGEEDLQSTGISWEEQSPTFSQPPSSQPSLLFPSGPHWGVYPQTPQVPQYPEYPETPQAPHIDCAHLFGFSVIDRCAATPRICGHGKCIPVQTGYTCQCEPGFKLSALQTNCIDVNECAEDPCEGKGRCINSYGSYTCQCHNGYSQVITQNRKFCQDINECSMPNKCQDGKCVNTEGSYTCECYSGYAKSRRGLCEDVDECRDPESCPNGVCVNTLGSFQCQACRPGFRPVSDRCVDVNECLNQTVCGRGRCVNTEGSFRCNCFQGYELSPDNICQDVDECVLQGVCLNGRCVNLDGTHRCTCNHGYRVTSDSKACEDVNECATGNACPVGICINTAGSYTCQNCRPGFRPSADGLRCEDVDECAQGDLCLGGVCANTDGSYTCTKCKAGICTYTHTHTHTLWIILHIKYTVSDVNECLSTVGICGEGHCLNTEGSYSCIWRKLNAVTLFPTPHPCKYIYECVNETICGSHGFCENTDGSFRCQCDRGYTNAPGDMSRCVDVNECEMSLALCREALCENVDGSFLCICPNDNEEFDPNTSQCLSLGNRAGLKPAARVPPIIPSAEERKECYYNLNDANFCDNVLSRNTTKQECCCTVGAGWGDNCEIHACPVPGKDDYNQLCPHGQGLLPSTLSSAQSLGDQRPFIDANECEMFGSDICKNGKCSNFFSTYTCYCRSGFYYDNIRLECVDYDECEFGNACEDGACMNTAGSFSCFCSPPLVLDSTRRRCIKTPEPEHDVHMDICWRHLEGGNICSDPLQGHRTTYTECCCLYGMAWSEQCAFCPRKDSNDYAIMCNLPQRGRDSLRERQGYDYDPEGPEDPAEPFVPLYWDNYGIPESVPLFNDNDYSVRQPPVRVPNPPPRVQQPQPAESFAERYDSFEGLQAEECGILNGCENGRCVRVREGYTCDCFDGYELDLSKMACIDINECEDISDKVPLCQNGQCTNTEGSYKCTCLPGFVASAQPHKSVKEGKWP